MIEGYAAVVASGPGASNSNDRVHFQVAPSSSDSDSESRWRPCSVSLLTSAQLPDERPITSRPAPGFAISVSTTALHDWPLSFDSLLRTLLGGGPLSRISATSVPSFLRTRLGCTPPWLTSGWLA